MKNRLASMICALMSGFYAGEDSLLNQFLGSPLLALVAIIIIVVMALLYRKIRK
ncbi:MAG: hypothetical protein QXZ68_05070 [Candidatus Bathyarchaeia archaeon]